MIALDTNLLVRFLVRDDAAQTEQATALVKRAIHADEPLFVSNIVLCEVAWVLGTAYDIDRAQLCETLGKLVRARHLTFRDTDLLLRALEAFEAGKGDFADYLIREEAREAGAAAVATFDKDLLRDDGYVRP